MQEPISRDCKAVAREVGRKADYNILEAKKEEYCKEKVSNCMKICQSAK